MSSDKRVTRLYELRVRRVRRACDLPYDQVVDNVVAARVFNELCAGEGREVFMSLHLATHKRVIGAEVVAVGGVNRVFVEARDVFRAAILSGADSVIVGHNHPSGALVPSSEDRSLTRTLREGGRLLGVPVVDHLIVRGVRGDRESFSFLHEAEALGWGW